MSSPERAEHRASPRVDAADLYELHAGQVAAICHGLLRDREEAADAAQQTFLSAHRALLAGTHPEEPAAWLATIARNECRQRIRRGMAAPTTTPLDDALGAGDDGTHAAAERARSVAELRQALAGLPERQREALLLREIRGLSYDEVAATMGTTAPAVETLLVRARRSVAERIGVLPALGVGWAKELVARLSGPADAASAVALAAKGAAALVAAFTATGAAVEVQHRVAGEPVGAAAAVRVDNSGPGSGSSGHGRGRGRGGEGRDPVAGTDTAERSGSGRGRGRGRGRSGEERTVSVVSSGREDRRRSGSDDSGSGSGSDKRSGSDDRSGSDGRSGSDDRSGSEDRSGSGSDSSARDD